MNLNLVLVGGGHMEVFPIIFAQMQFPSLPIMIMIA